MRIAVALFVLPIVAAIFAAGGGACGGPEFAPGASGDGGGSGEGPDALAESSTGSASFCAIEAGAHTLCDDFDGPSLTTLWPVYDRSPLATAEDVTSIFVSAPKSFDAALPVSATSTIHARLGHQLTLASRVVVAFDVHLDKVALKAGTSGMTFFLITLGADYNVGLSANDADVSFFEDQTIDGSAANTTQLVAHTPSVLGNWAHVVFDVDLANARASITIDGSATAKPITPPTGIAPSVFLGLSSHNSVAVESHYDNVTIDVTP